MPPDNNDSHIDEVSYREAALLIKHELSRFNKWCAKIDQDLTDFRLEMTREIATLKVKAGVWGLIGASVPIVLVLAIAVLKGWLVGRPD